MSLWCKAQAKIHFIGTCNYRFSLFFISMVNREVACPTSLWCRRSHSHNVLWKAKDPLYRTGAIKHMLISHDWIRLLMLVGRVLPLKLQTRESALWCWNCFLQNIKPPTLDIRKQTHSVGLKIKIPLLQSSASLILCQLVIARVAVIIVLMHPRMQEWIGSFQQMEFLPVCGLIFWYGQPGCNISKSLQGDSYNGLALLLFRKKCISKEALTVRQQRFKIALWPLEDIGTTVSWSFRKWKNMPVLVEFNRQLVNNYHLEEHVMLVDWESMLYGKMKSDFLLIAVIKIGKDHLLY